MFSLFAEVVPSFPENELYLICRQAADCANIDEVIAGNGSNGRRLCLFVEKLAQCIVADVASSLNPDMRIDSSSLRRFEKHIKIYDGIVVSLVRSFSINRSTDLLSQGAIRTFLSALEVYVAVEMDLDDQLSCCDVLSHLHKANELIIHAKEQLADAATHLSLDDPLTISVENLKQLLPNNDDMLPEVDSISNIEVAKAACEELARLRGLDDVRNDGRFGDYEAIVQRAITTLDRLKAKEKELDEESLQSRLSGDNNLLQMFQSSNAGVFIILQQHRQEMRGEYRRWLVEAAKLDVGRQQERYEQQSRDRTALASSTKMLQRATVTIQAQRIVTDRTRLEAKHRAVKRVQGFIDLLVFIFYAGAVIYAYAAGMNKDGITGLRKLHMKDAGHWAFGRTRKLCEHISARQSQQFVRWNYNSTLNSSDNGGGTCSLSGKQQKQSGPHRRDHTDASPTGASPSDHDARKDGGNRGNREKPAAASASATTITESSSGGKSGGIFDVATGGLFQAAAGGLLKIATDTLPAASDLKKAASDLTSQIGIDTGSILTTATTSNILDKGAELASSLGFDTLASTPSSILETGRSLATKFGLDSVTASGILDKGASIAASFGLNQDMADSIVTTGASIASSMGLDTLTTSGIMEAAASAASSLGLDSITTTSIMEAGASIASTMHLDSNTTATLIHSVVALASRMQLDAASTLQLMRTWAAVSMTLGIDAAWISTAAEVIICSLRVLAWTITPTLLSYVVRIAGYPSIAQWMYFIGMVYYLSDPLYVALGPLWALFFLLSIHAGMYTCVRAYDHRINWLVRDFLFYFRWLSPPSRLETLLFREASSRTFSSTTTSIPTVPIFFQRFNVRWLILYLCYPSVLLFLSFVFGWFNSET